MEESFETSIDIELDAYIPNGYIANEYQKLDIYKRIAAIENEEEKDEMLDELIDRFGEPPRSVQNLLTSRTDQSRCSSACILWKSKRMRQ